MTTALPDDKTLADLEQKYDPEMRFRPLTTGAATVVGALLLLLSLFHYYTAGFGLLHEVTHRGVHLALVLGLIFLVFPHRHALLEKAAVHRVAAPGNVPWFDWLLAVAVAASVLYIPYIFEDLTFRVGNPLPDGGPQPGRQRGGRLPHRLRPHPRRGAPARRRDELRRRDGRRRLGRRPRARLHRAGRRRRLAAPPDRRARRRPRAACPAREHRGPPARAQARDLTRTHPRPGAPTKETPWTTQRACASTRPSCCSPRTRRRSPSTRSSTSTPVSPSTTATRSSSCRSSAGSPPGARSRGTRSA